MRRQFAVVLICFVVGAVSLGTLGVGELDSSWQTTVMNGYGAAGVGICVLILEWQDEFFAANLSVFALTGTPAHEAEGIAYVTDDVLTCLFPQADTTRVDTFLYESETDTLAWQWSVEIAGGEYSAKDVQFLRPYERKADSDDS